MGHKRLTIPEKRYFWVMEAKYIIADSGGSSTNWAIVLTTNEVVFLQTESLHPKYVFSKEHAFSNLKEQFGAYGVPLYFYGAGCSSETVQGKMTAFLEPFGFSEVHVYPDTLAACRALYGLRSGWLAILGTGSVLVYYDGVKITQRIGGYGSLVGDEGSGFYFGKLLVRYLLQKEEWETAWTQLFQSKESLLSKLAGADAQQWISGLGKEVAGFDFAFLHRQNAELFVETHCISVPGLEQISFIGSYGYEQRDIFSEVFERYRITVEKAIASPLEDLTGFHKMSEY
ncbi:hypothetical protein D3C87_200970 [compost metagenome]